MVPSFDEALVRGFATYGLELLHAVDGLETVYVPIGLGSGICGTIAVREALGLTTSVVGVVSDAAPTYALSFAGRVNLSRRIRRIPKLTGLRFASRTRRQSKSSTILWSA
jgi:threonine dehydratase